jgi:hypothetical protein
MEWSSFEEFIFAKLVEKILDFPFVKDPITGSRPKN